MEILNTKIMKTTFLTIIFSILCTVAFGNESKLSPPSISKMEISNLEILNLDTGNYLFKRNNCDNEGFSMFNPFFENPELGLSEIKSTLENDEINFSILNSKMSENINLKNFTLSEDKSSVIFEATKLGVTFPVKIYGENLTIEYVKNYFNSASSSLAAAPKCGPCIGLAIVAIMAICENASSGCTPCNGKLTVKACGCSCEPK